MQAGTVWCLPVQFRFISVGRLIIAPTVLADILVAASMNACPTLFGMKFTVGHGFIRAVLEFIRADFCFYAPRVMIGAKRLLIDPLRDRRGCHEVPGVAKHNYGAPEKSDRLFGERRSSGMNESPCNQISHDTGARDTELVTTKLRISLLRQA